MPQLRVATEARLEAALSLLADKVDRGDAERAARGAHVAPPPAQGGGAADLLREREYAWDEVMRRRVDADARLKVEAEVGRRGAAEERAAVR